MAEVNNSTNSTETKANNNSKKFKIFMTEHLKFNSIADSKFITSKEFCELVSSVMRQVYADWEGCNMVTIPNQNNILSIDFFFNHTKGDNNLPYACSKEVNDDKSTNSTIASIRNRDRRLASGDTFHLTKEGKEGITPLLINSPYHFNRSTGEVKWGKIMADISDPNSQYMYGSPRVQYTRISYIDPAKVAGLLYGDTDEEDRHYVYTVNLCSSLPNMGFAYGSNNNPNTYMLNIQRISSEETEKLARESGFVFNNGLNIIR